ncbi:DNA replication protein psf1 [Tieghemiomyces parasiticus]|uniref:DNA replication complex GINS protein PSF1 n=1 Tax=Tieghemiomyces parasiticus TaxID=78921 RepID=A0A9W8DXM1_9FUNG|nr:DNA replication protein psf1 [Tieghemiomyces parasiticus]KAJ1927896.1 DNA replication protein psf1 [Tieghemiomyces parasiticus]
MLGDSAYKLALETKRTQAHLPMYNEALVHHLCRETRHIMGELETLLQSLETIRDEPDADTRSVAAQLAVKHATVKRNKRCLLAYQAQRLRFLQNVFWQVGGVPEEIKPQLSPAELDFFSGYALAVNTYKAPFIDLDLTVSDLPPKDLYIEVRVLQDCGEVQLENGSLLLSKNSQHHVKRTDVDHLVSRGLLQHIDG